MNKKGRVAAKEGSWWASELAAYWATGQTGKDSQRAAAAALRVIGDLHQSLLTIADDTECPANTRRLATITLQACGLDTSHIDEVLYAKVPIQMLADLMAGMRHHFKPGMEEAAVQIITGLLVAALNQAPLSERERLQMEAVGMVAMAVNIDNDEEHSDDG